MSQGFSCPQSLSQSSTPTPEEIAFSNATDVGLELSELTDIPTGTGYSEDCLSLNVWSKPQSGEAQKAVMIFIYGGGFSGGSSVVPVYDGSPLVDQYDVVIVTFK
jgi:cholinesterase